MLYIAVFPHLALTWETLQNVTVERLCILAEQVLGLQQVLQWEPGPNSSPMIGVTAPRLLCWFVSDSVETAAEAEKQRRTQRQPRVREAALTAFTISSFEHGEFSHSGLNFISVFLFLNRSAVFWKEPHGFL